MIAVNLFFCVAKKPAPPGAAGPGVAYESGDGGAYGTIHAVWSMSVTMV